MIQFNKPIVLVKEIEYMIDAMNSKQCGDGKYTKMVTDFFVNKFGYKNFMLTTSGSTALDMSAILLDLKAGDEVIVPSYTFVSTANAFLLRDGVKAVFCDIEPETMNMDANLIEKLITPKTKAIYCVHYAGRVCDMDKIMAIAKAHNLYVVEDAAQAVGSFYKGKPAGSFGDMACFSFHETKNFSMGEGGALIVNNPKFIERAEIIREKGTNRKQFLLGQVDKYTWRDIGSSYLPSDVLAAMLYAQLEKFDDIQARRLEIWHKYQQGLMQLEKQGKITLQIDTTKDTTNNAHMFYFLTKNIDERTKLISFLKQNDIAAVFHYVPLHTAPFAVEVLKNNQQLPLTDDLSSRIVRLPLHLNLTDAEVEKVIDCIKQFYKEN